MADKFIFALTVQITLRRLKINEMDSGRKDLLLKIFNLETMGEALPACKLQAESDDSDDCEDKEIIPKCLNCQTYDTYKIFYQLLEQTE